jgi:hypothetical protein
MENTSTSLSNTFLKYLQDAIQKQKEDEFQSLIHRIPLSKLPFEETNKLLIYLLTFIEQNNFIPGLKIVLKFWGGMEVGFDDYVGQDLYPVIPTLFLDPTIPIRILKFIMISMEDVMSVEEVAIELIEKGNGDQLKNALKNLFDILGEPSGETFRILMDEAIQSEKEEGIEFFSSLQSYFMKPVERPKYIDEGEQKDLPEEKKLLEIADEVADEITNVEIDCEDLDGLVIFLTSGLQKYGIVAIDVEQVQESLREKLSHMTVDERKEYMKSFLNQQSFEDLNANETLFCILGPVNPIVNGDFTKSDHICYKYGGCRMFYCNCYESDWLNPDDEDKPYYPNIPLWFTGVCENCGREVQKRCYAVRRPLPQGGWRGTYCSWSCLYESGNVDDALSSKLCDLIEKKMYQETIFDRKESDVEELLNEAENKDEKGFVYRLPIMK